MKAKITISFLLFPILSSADVNMRDASFILRMNEISHPIFSRIYNSRSLHSGSFGFGWCAEFEKTISVSGSIRKNCHQKSKVELKQEKGLWVYKDKKGTIEKYNSLGLLKFYKKTGHPLAELHYNSKGVLETIEIQKKKTIFEKNKKTGHITAILSADQSAFQYQYQGQNLVTVSNKSGKSFRFQYDAFHNLVEAENPARQKLWVAYNTLTDEVQSTKSSSGCIENYQFQKISSIELKSTVQRSCPSTPVRKKTYSFLARKTSKGLILSQIKTSGGLHETQFVP